MNYISGLKTLGDIIEPDLMNNSYVFSTNYDASSSQFDGPSMEGDDDKTYSYMDDKQQTLNKSIKGGNFNPNDFVNVASLD